MKPRIIINLLLCLGLALSVSPAFLTPFEGSGGDPASLAFLEYGYHFLIHTNIWPFFFLQLLLCYNVERGWVTLLPLAGFLLLLAAGFCYVSTANPGAGGLLVIMMSLFYTGFPIIGSLLALALWSVLRWLGRL